MKTKNFVLQNQLQKILSTPPPVTHPLTVTMQQIWDQKPYGDDWFSLNKKFKDDAGPISILEIAKILGFGRGFWLALKAIPDCDAVLRLFAADCAKLVYPIWQECRPEDTSVRETIEASRRYALGEISLQELRAVKAEIQKTLRGTTERTAWTVHFPNWTYPAYAACSAAYDEAIYAAESATWHGAYDQKPHFYGPNPETRAAQIQLLGRYIKETA